MSLIDALTLFGFTDSVMVPDAGQIKGTYRRLAKKLHPDVNNSPTAHKDFEDLQEAYSLLLSKAGQVLMPRLRHYSLFDIGF